MTYAAAARAMGTPSVMETVAFSLAIFLLEPVLGTPE